MLSPDTLGWVNKALILTCLVLAVLLGAKVYGLVTAGDPQSELAETRLTIADAPLGADGKLQHVIEPTDDEANGDHGAGNGDGNGNGKGQGASKGDSKGATATKAGAAKVAGKTKAKPKKKPKPKLPEEYDVITKKYIFGIKPPRKLLPMLLEGIAGDYAFIRTPTGASGAVKLGKTYAGVKLLELDHNRALVEYKGEKKELTMYGGVGSKSLLAKAKAAAKSQPTASSTGNGNTPPKTPADTKKTEAKKTGTKAVVPPKVITPASLSPKPVPSGTSVPAKKLTPPPPHSAEGKK